MMKHPSPKTMAASSIILAGGSLYETSFRAGVSAERRRLIIWLRAESNKGSKLTPAQLADDLEKGEWV